MSIGRALRSADLLPPDARPLTLRTNVSKAGGHRARSPGRRARRSVEERRPRHVAGRRRFVVRRATRSMRRFAAQLLRERAENGALAVAEIGAGGRRCRTECIRGLDRGRRAGVAARRTGHGVGQIEHGPAPGRNRSEHLRQLYGLFDVVVLRSSHAYAPAAIPDRGEVASDGTQSSSLTRPVENAADEALARAGEENRM